MVKFVVEFGYFDADELNGGCFQRLSTVKNVSATERGSECRIRRV